MIFTLLVDVVTGFATIIFSFLPTWSPVDVSGYEYSLPGVSHLGYFHLINHFIPLDLALTFILLQLALWGAYLGYQGVVWLLTKLHVLGGSSD